MLHLYSEMKLPKASAKVGPRIDSEWKVSPLNIATATLQDPAAACDTEKGSGEEFVSDIRSVSYIDVDFNAPSRARGTAFIRFSNFYTASISIKQKLVGETCFKTVLGERCLMDDADYEDEAQATFDVPTSCFLPCFKPENVTTLRFYLLQPSKRWIKNEIRNISFHMRTAAKNITQQSPMNFDNFNVMADDTDICARQLSAFGEELGEQLASLQRIQVSTATKIGVWYDVLFPEADSGEKAGV